jgi:hypothetical protein
MPNDDFYNRQRRRTELDMRQEMNSFLDGSLLEIPKAQQAVLRKMRKDSGGDLIPCACVDSVTQEPDVDTFCPYCFGEAFYWDESFIEIYRMVLRSDVGNALKETQLRPTVMNIPIVVFYARSSIDVTEKDKIVELVLDKEGFPVKPYRRKNLYSLDTVFDIRSDNGRLEYWKLTGYKEDRKFLNGASL